MKKYAIAAAVLPLVLVWAAACGEPARHKNVASAGSGATPSPTATLSFLDQGLRYARCMRENGLPDYPDPEVTGDNVRIVGVDKTKVDTTVLAGAQQACRALRPVLTGPDGAQKAAAARYESQCMREHGLADYPDPDPDGHAEVPDAVRQNPLFDAARAACRDLTRSFTPSPAATN
ncbi:hypothetical protein ACQPZX_14095 [Actinoplanes sp. CA-142083]|uniref:hypothetical protein n=1 Tax=Actinoplanes sp. CA-142083 TaxID=3239903 RepID=UPI003D8D0E86